MKLFLFLVLFAFSAHAQSVGAGDLQELLSNAGINPSIIFSGFSNPHQIYSSVSPYCVENNFGKCVELGYTITANESPCGNDGIACPYDDTLWNCSSWRCKELGLHVKQPQNMTCESITVEDVICYKCMCDLGYINYEGCEGLIETLTNKEDVAAEQMCDDLGYTDLITDEGCRDYLACPASFNKVRCLHTVGCTEKSCIATTTVPIGAEPIYEEKDCDCGGSRNVITGWTCKSGYRKLENEGNSVSCVKQTCPSNQFEGAGPQKDEYVTCLSESNKDGHVVCDRWSIDLLECLTEGIEDNVRVCLKWTSEDQIEDCYQFGQNTASGWVKQTDTTNNKSGTQCYTCECHLPSSCTFTKEDEGEFGSVDGYLCCNNIHYSGCVRQCPSNKSLPEKGAVPDKKICDACGEKTEYISGWHCKDGYILNELGKTCDERPCPTSSNGYYYSETYTASDDCLQISAGTGWQFEAQPSGAQKGEGWCGLCYCPLSEMTRQGYIYSYSTEDNTSFIELDQLGCNGKYKSCVNKKKDDPDFFAQGEVPEHAVTYSPYTICGEIYYQFRKCEQGYKYRKETRECLPEECSNEYNIEGYDCPDGAKCSHCFSGESIRTKIDSCILAPRFLTNEFKTACCDQHCGDDNGEYIVPQVAGQCPEGKTLIPSDARFNTCGQECIKCK